MLKNVSRVIALVIALSGASLESGCADLNAALGATVPASTAIVAANSYDAVEVVATGYLNLPLCVTNGSLVCRTAAMSAQITTAVRNGRKARAAVESLITAGATTIPVASYNTLDAAITALQALESQLPKSAS